MAGDDEPVAAVWIGGTPGSGKSTIARRLACELDLPLHPVDAFTYDHQARLAADGVEPRPLEEVLALGPETAADDFELVGDRRLPMIMADLRAAAVPGVPVVVEGPQLRPDHVARAGPAAAVWLVTTPERTRLAREQRLVEGDEAGRRRVEGLVARDRVIGERLDRGARRAQLPVVTVATDPDWEAVTDAVRRVVRSALRGRRALQPGAELAIRRRHENDVVARQLKAYATDLGLALPPYPFACTCGRSGCADVELR